MTDAPVCKISRPQAPPTTTPVKTPTRLPAIPIATDLPSLIRAVNIMRDILREITTSLTVNNVWEPQTGANIYFLSDFPSWDQVDAELKEGYVFHHNKDGTKDKSQRAYVQRTNAIKFQNKEAGGEQFTWRLVKELDSEFGESNGVTPFAEDFFERIIDVNWGFSVIVVFLGQTVFEAQNPLILKPIKGDSGEDKATFLRSWRTPYQSNGFMPGFESTAYKVAANAGEFMETVGPATPNNDYGTSADAYVFAIEDGDVDKSLDRAEAGVKKIVPAQYMMFHSVSDIPYDMCPPGLLWGVACGDTFPGTSIKWKMRYGKHRADDNTTPPNTMVQCYPLGPSYSGPIGGGGGQTAETTGYQLYGYRLDKNGTDTIYSRMPYVNEDPLEQKIDPAWNQETSSKPGGFTKGIPFQDPPPLIGSDQVT